MDARTINKEFEELPSEAILGLFEPKFENNGQLRFKKINKPVQASGKLV